LPFLRTMFKNFFNHKEIFALAVQCVAELDCLCALASISLDDTSGPMCRPEIVDGNGGVPLMELRQMRHPCVVDLMQKANFVDKEKKRKFIPNDCLLGHGHKED
jgi:DNA mismatch repair ATPase MutS